MSIDDEAPSAGRPSFISFVLVSEVKMQQAAFDREEDDWKMNKDLSCQLVHAIQSTSFVVMRRTEVDDETLDLSITNSMK